MAQYAVRDNAALDALLSAHRGASRPAYAVASTIWVKAGTAPVTDAEIYYFDGTNDILIATMNESTNVITFAGLGTAAVLDVGTSANNIAQLNASGQLPAVDGSLLTGIAGDSRNLIADPDFRVTPEATSMTAATTPANNDDTYFNQLILLSDSNDIVDLSIDTTVKPTGAYASLKFDVQTANKKFGFLIPFRARDAAEIIGGVASAGFEARTTTGAVVENIRIGLVTWDGTADSITSDIISAWAAEGTNPTLVANWTFENTPANQVVTADAFGEHKIENVSIDTASGKNVGLLVWVDDTDAAINDLLYISKLRVNSGSTLISWRPNSTAEESSRMSRMLFLDGGRGFSGHVLNATTVVVDVSFPEAMDVPPTATLIDTSPTVNIGSDITGSGSAIAAGVTTRGAKINVNGFTGLTVGQGLSLNNLTTVFKFDGRL